MGRFTDAGTFGTSRRRVRAREPTVPGPWGLTGADPPLGVDTPWRARYFGARLARMR